MTIANVNPCFTVEDIGRNVLYVPMHANGDTTHPDVERGVITGLGRNPSHTIFVRFGEQSHAKACYPNDLVFVL